MHGTQNDRSGGCFVSYFLAALYFFVILWVTVEDMIQETMTEKLAYYVVMSTIYIGSLIVALAPYILIGLLILWIM